MRRDREECGIHSASQSALHQQPHNGGVLLMRSYLCVVLGRNFMAGWHFLDLPQVGWLGWRHREVPATSRFVEEVRVLYFTLRFRPRIG